MTAAPAVAQPITRDRYLYSLPYQQSAFAPDDPRPEDCTWSIADYHRFHRFWLAITGRLDTWVDDLAVDRIEADALHPGFAAGFPSYDAPLAGRAPAYESRW